MIAQRQATDTLHEWQESARYWKKHSATIHSMFAPLTYALIEDAGIKTGHLVLDVAGGAGEPSLTIAGVVGPTGSVMCTDAVEEMVIAAENEAHERGIENVLGAILKEAGATDVSERISKFRIEAPISVEEFWTMRSEVSEILRERLKSLTEVQSLRVAQEVQDDVRQFFCSSDGIAFLPR